jgi:hypothetical protein
MTINCRLWRAPHLSTRLTWAVLSESKNFYSPEFYVPWVCWRSANWAHDQEHSCITLWINLNKSDCSCFVSRLFIFHSRQNSKQFSTGLEPTIFGFGDRCQLNSPGIYPFVIPVTSQTHSGARCVRINAAVSSFVVSQDWFKMTRM